MGEVVLGGDGQGGASDRTEVERGDTDDAAARVANRAAAETGIGGREPQRALEPILPVGVEGIERSNRRAHRAALLVAHARDRDDVSADCDHRRVARLQRHEIEPRHAQHGETARVVVRDEDAFVLSTADVDERDLVRADHDVVDGEHEAATIDEGAGAETAGAEHGHRRMRLGNLGGDRERRLREVLQ